MFDPIAFALGFLIGASTSYIIATLSMAISQYGNRLRIKRMKDRATRRDWAPINDAFSVDWSKLEDDAEKSFGDWPSLSNQPGYR